MMSALTTVQNLLRVIISEATDIAKENRPSRAQAILSPLQKGFSSTNFNRERLQI